jgi:shikimate dehydrogenase
MKLYGVLGDRRVKHSLSPRMHNYVLKKNGLPGEYTFFALDSSEVGQAIHEFKHQGLAGVNVTVPHKQAVMPHLEKLSPEAEALGAVNTIVPLKKGLMGHNTDVGGFIDAVEQVDGTRLLGCRVLIFGAGGASRAVIYALKDRGANEIWVASRNVKRTSAMAAELGVDAVSLDAARELVQNASLIINATSVSSPSESAPMAILAAQLVPGPDCSQVMDLNYGRDLNFWADLARRHGVPFQDGLYMLAAQARLSYKLWSGKSLPINDYLEGLHG